MKKSVPAHVLAALGPIVPPETTAGCSNSLLGFQGSVPPPREACVHLKSTCERDEIIPLTRQRDEADLLHIRSSDCRISPRVIISWLATPF